MFRHGSSSSYYSTRGASQPDYTPMPQESDFVSPSISPTSTFRSRTESLPEYSPGKHIDHIEYAQAFPYDKLEPEMSSPDAAKPQTTTTNQKIIHGFQRYIIGPQLFLIRLPYCGLYRHYIEKPTRQLESLVGPIRPGGREVPVSRVLAALDSWKGRILEQLTIVIVANTLIATTSIAILSWQSLDIEKRSEAWVTMAMMYSSIALSVSSVLLALQQQSVLKGFDLTKFGERARTDSAVSLSSMPDHKFQYESERTRIAEIMLNLILPKTPNSLDAQYKLDVFRLYVWQAPAMLMSYSACLFVCGFSLHALYPLFLVGKTGWTSNAKVRAILRMYALTAVVFLGLGTFAMVNFILSSYLLNGRYLEWKIEQDGDMVV